MTSMRKAQSEPDDEHFWPSFTDVMSSLVFVLFFFIVILFIKQLMTAEITKSQLNMSAAALSEKETLLTGAENELYSINTELEERQQEMAVLEKSLSEREDRINHLQAQLSRDQKALSQKETELSKVKNQLQEISLLRLSLLSEVKASIEAELGSIFKTGAEAQVAIDDNANLVIQSSLLFAKGSSEISGNGSKMLRQFSLAFEKILSNPSVQSNIDSITISGYADSDDTYEYNYDLSCQRAIAVITSMMKENSSLEKNYGRFFQASGFSEFRPLVNETSEAAKTKNRRIQIAINIKDSNIREIITDYMSTQP